MSLPLKGGLVVVVAALLAMTLGLTRGLVLGHAHDPETTPDIGLATQPLPEPSSDPGDNSVDATAPTVAPVAPAPPAVSRMVAGTFFSAAMQAQRSFEVYLPPSYDQASDRSYPVLYLLHGDGGRVDDWAALGLRTKMDRNIASGAPEMIVALADGSGPSGDLTDWANRWDGTEAVEDQVLDLVNYVDRVYRTLPDRSTRFIGGLSSGGFGALNLALHHPELFSTAMSFSGFIAADDPEADPGVFGEDPTYIQRNSPAALVASEGTARDIYYVLSGGQNDPYFQHRMAEFSAELDGLGIAHEFHVVPGGHDGTAWAAGLDFGLRQLAEQVRAAITPVRHSS